jgi:PAS domain S-box-containing protein
VTKAQMGLLDEYLLAFQDYLEGAGEAALLRAYDLGRRAMDEGAGILDMATIHQEILGKSLAEAKATVEATGIAKAGASFLAECLSPFEITHRSFKDAYAALKASEERYRELFENANDIVFTLDLEGNFTSINRAGEEISGYSRSQLPDVNFADILTPEHVSLAHQMRESKLAGGGPTTYEVDIVARDGRVVPVEVSTRLIYDQGKPAAVQGIGRDISARKRAEEVERESKERFRLLFENLKDYAITTLDTLGRVTSWNLGARRIQGYEEEEIIGRNFACFFLPKDARNGRPEQLLRLAETEGRVEDEGWRLRKDSSRFWADMVLTALRDPKGGLRGYAEIIRDVTDRRRQEEALQRMNEALEQQTRRIAHALHDESGQLLASVHIALEEVAGRLPPRTRKDFKKVKHLLDQIEEQLRQFSHELRPTILDDLGLWPALKFLAQSVSKRTGMVVVVEGGKDGRFPPPVEAALYRIAQEALTNIARHAKANEVNIQIRSEPGMISGTIKDNGRGFDAAAVLGRKGRRGFGLEGIRARIEALGGTFLIRSKPRQGTELLFTIPAGK